MLVSKVIKKEEISKYSTAKINNIEANKYDEIAWSSYHNSKYGKAKRYFKKACKLGLKEACENVIKAEDSKKEARIAKSFYNNADSIFGGIVAVDIGFGGGSVNMPSTPYLYRVGNNAVMSIYSRYDSLNKISNYPIALRIGGFTKKR